MKTFSTGAVTGLAVLLATCLPAAAWAQSERYDALANLPFKEGFLPKEGIVALKDELVFQRAVQSYIWALPALNIASGSWA